MLSSRSRQRNPLATRPFRKSSLDVTCQHLTYNIQLIEKKKVFFFSHCFDVPGDRNISALPNICFARYVRLQSTRVWPVRTQIRMGPNFIKHLSRSILETVLGTLQKRIGARLPGCARAGRSILFPAFQQHVVFRAFYWISMASFLMNSSTHFQRDNVINGL